MKLVACLLIAILALIMVAIIILSLAVCSSFEETPEEKSEDKE